MPEKVVELFETMSIKADEVTIILLFNACAKLCNTRAIQLGKHVFTRLPTTSLQNQQLINSAIDMFMKFGDVKNTELLFEKIKKKTLVSYGAMMHGDLSSKIYQFLINS